MKSTISIFVIPTAAALLQLVSCGIIHHDLGDDHKATSYQNVHIEHFHPVPTYIKKEDTKLLEHPISIGSSSSNLEVHHGGKHDHGFALASVENDLHGQHLGAGIEHELNFAGEHGNLEHESIGSGGEINLDGGEGHEELNLGGGSDLGGGGYEVHDQGSDYGQYQGHLGDTQFNLGSYDHLGHYEASNSGGDAAYSGQHY